MDRGLCPVCHYSWAMTRDGRIYRHHLWALGKSRPCEGIGQSAIPSRKLVDRANRLRAASVPSRDEGQEKLK